MKIAYKTRNLSLSIGKSNLQIFLAERHTDGKRNYSHMRNPNKILDPGIKILRKIPHKQLKGKYF